MSDVSRICVCVYDYAVVVKNKNHLFKQFLCFGIIAVWMFVLEMVTD